MHIIEWLGNRARGLLLAACIAIVPMPFAAAAEGGPDASVVRIFTTARPPDPLAPWNRQPTREVTGSGVVIEGNRILTNAHVVLHAMQVKVEGSTGGEKYVATVEALAPGIDLAVLKLEDAGFFASHKPLRRAGKLPAIKDNVLVYGFPAGGSALSITKGIVSRIEFAGYSYPTSGLRIQIDAAINPGNSGGPAMGEDGMVGIAFSVLTNTQGIGYIIPNEEIDLFLKDVADGRYEGKPAMYDVLQTLENPGLRTYLKLPPSTRGIVVRQPYAGIPGNPLRELDVISRIGDAPVDDQGMVALEGGLRVRFAYLVQRLASGGKVPLTVVRGGREQRIDMPVVASRPLLIPSLEGAYPPYFIHGPVAFSIATVGIAASLARNNAVADALVRAGSPLFTRRADLPTPEQQELVIIAGPFFPHRLANGYGNMAGAVVESVNGVRLRSLRHLVELLRDSKDEFLVFRMGESRGETLVFPRSQMQEATEGVLRDNGLRDRASPELLAVWEGRPAS